MENQIAGSVEAEAKADCDLTFVVWVPTFMAQIMILSLSKFPPFREQQFEPYLRNCPLTKSHEVRKPLGSLSIPAMVLPQIRVVLQCRQTIQTDDSVFTRPFHRHAW